MASWQADSDLDAVFRVVSPSNANQAYGFEEVLLCQDTVPVCPDDDVYEYGFPSTPLNADADTTLTAASCGGDTDEYFVSVDAGCTFTADMSDDGGDLSLHLEDNAAQTIADSVHPADQDESVSWTPTVADFAWLTVLPVGSDEATYVLQTSVTCP